MWAFCIQDYTSRAAYSDSTAAVTSTVGCATLPLCQACTESTTTIIIIPATTMVWPTIITIREPMIMVMCMGIMSTVSRMCTRGR